MYRRGRTFQKPRRKSSAVLRERKDNGNHEVQLLSGCTLKNKAKDLDAYARASAEALGFDLEEIEDWQCCGGVYPLAAMRSPQSFLPSVL